MRKISDRQEAMIWIIVTVIGILLVAIKTKGEEPFIRTLTIMLTALFLLGKRDSESWAPTAILIALIIVW